MCRLTVKNASECYWGSVLLLHPTMTNGCENKGAEVEAREVQQASCNAKCFYILPAGLLYFSILRKSVDGY